MRQNIMRHIILLSTVLISIGTYAADFELPDISESQRQSIVRKNIARTDSLIDNDLVIVKGDTVSMIIPTKNYGRFDRGLYNYLYIPKKDWAFGLTASYGSLSTEDLELLSVIENFNFKGERYTIHPSVAYFFDHNQSIGIRMIYTHGTADLASLDMDIVDDMSISLHDVSYHSNNYKGGIFYRNYVGLNHQKRFAVFNEVSFDVGGGKSSFKRYYGDTLYDTTTKTVDASLNFSPGVCVFIQDYVAFNVSFGVFGIKLTKESQKTNGVDDGTRFSSGANFRFNIFNINFGLLVVI